ncbi:MAG TPA: PIG-L deacetylase family protein [Candidatus Saccharimonadales bacterium]|nr:PIG-L deacetylase family protein [Candidatus Saccharimonadales bacterium]
MSEKKVVLGVGAHPDDMEFGASGTIAKLVEEGWDAYYIIATDGSRGSKDPQMTHARLSGIRRDEQLAAAKVLGLKDVFFLGHTDTQLVADQALKEEIVRIIRKVRPSIVITMNPTFYYYAGEAYGFVNHTDHRNVGLATLDAVFPMSRDRLTFLDHEKEGLSPWRVEELWFVNFIEKQHVVDITSTWDKKVAALKVHKSQFGDFEKETKRFKMRAEEVGKEKGYQYAESFVKILMP